MGLSSRRFSSKRPFVSENARTRRDEGENFFFLKRTGQQIEPASSYSFERERRKAMVGHKIARVRRRPRRSRNATFQDIPPKRQSHGTIGIVVASTRRPTDVHERPSVSRALWQARPPSIRDREDVRWPAETEYAALSHWDRAPASPIHCVFASSSSHRSTTVYFCLPIR